jgi:hypothetical protein
MRSSTAKHGGRLDSLVDSRRGEQVIVHDTTKAQLDQIHELSDQRGNDVIRRRAPRTTDPRLASTTLVAGQRRAKKLLEGRSAGRAA